MSRSPTTGRGRDSVNALDVGRGVAIVSVMYGHALAPWFMSNGGNFSEAAFIQWKFGASFMMGLFFFLSGVSWREHKAIASTVRQSLTLILIALLASAAYDFARLVATSAGLTPRIGAQEIDAASFAAGLGRMIVFGDYYSFSALWFLVALALVRVLAALAVRMNAVGAATLTLALLALTFASTELGWRNIYQLNLIGVAFAFFLAGYAARDLFRALERRPAAACALLLLSGALLAATFDLNQGCRWDVAARCGLGWLNDRFGVAMIIGQFGNLPLFALTAIAGVAFASALSMLLALFGGVIGRRLDAWGGNSLNLLIVNCIFLHVGNQLVERWVAPYVAADNALFFMTLLAVTLWANLLAAQALERPLRALHRVARMGARQLVDAAAGASAALAWARRGDRVSQRHE
jgi:fucose 4-O-acetylase-like acetyltransferase